MADQGPVVVGLTGCTRSGKSWAAKTICSRLGLSLQSMVGQDGYWRRAVTVQTATRGQVRSEEEPDCTDHDAFVAGIQRAVAVAVTPVQGYSRPCVIVEGFQLLHDPKVAPLLSHIFCLDLGRGDCIGRRSAPSGPFNPNPMSVGDCEDLVWPAHERYISDKILPLGGRVRSFNSPTSEAELNVIVDAICTQVGFSTKVDAPSAESEPTTGKQNQGTWTKKKPFAELPEEEQLKIKGQWQARAQQEGRTPHGTEQVFKGVIIWRARTYGWIRPAEPATLPQIVQESMASMTAEFKAKAEASKRDVERFSQDVLYFRVCDRAHPAAMLDQGMEVQFKVYVDSKGAGAMEVEKAD